jgi:hypothetical protein
MYICAMLARDHAAPGGVAFSTAHAVVALARVAFEKITMRPAKFSLPVSVVTVVTVILAPSISPSPPTQPSRLWR